MTVLVVGEALIDIVEGAEGAVEHVGGSPLNVAVGVGRLGHPVRLATRIGRDARGETIAAHAAASGAVVTDASWTTTPTDTARARLAADGSARYEFGVAGEVAAVDPAGAALVHTGSIAVFRDPGGHTCLEVLRAAHGRSLITVDPNIRPALVGEREDALARFAEVAALADLVKLSDEDAEWMWPEASVDEVLTRVLALGPTVAVLTRGGAGASGRIAGRATVAVPAETVAVVDTIGAGDAFMASLVADLVGGGVPGTETELVDMLGRAGRAAAITVSRAGANPPTRAELASAFDEK